MSASANFASNPRTEVIQLSAANTNRDGTGTIVSAFMGGASGSRVERIEIKASAATTAGMVRAFKRKSAGTWMLWREYPIAAVTPSASTSSAAVIDDEIGELLADATWEIGFSTHNAEPFNVHVSGGNF